MCFELETKKGRDILVICEIMLMYIRRLESLATSSEMALEWVKLVVRFLVLAKFSLGFGGEMAAVLSAVQAHSVDLKRAIFVGVILGDILGICFGLWSLTGIRSTRRLLARSLARC